jgi:hypothetical protein
LAKDNYSFQKKQKELLKKKKRDEKNQKKLDKKNLQGQAEPDQASNEGVTEE